MLDQEGLGQLLTGLHGRSLADDLPYRASTTEYFFHAVELLDRRRLIDETLFVSLQALPAGKPRAIAAVALRWGIVLGPVPARLVSRRRGAVLAGLAMFALGSVLAGLFSPTLTVLPYPFAHGHAGIDDVWNPRREAALSGAIERAPAQLRGAWPELLQALQSHADTWQEVRIDVRENLIRDPEGRLQVAGLCLRQALQTVDDTLRAIEGAALLAEVPGDPVWSPMIHQWLLDLRPAGRCRDPRFLASLAAQSREHGLVMTLLRGGDRTWRRLEAEGMRHLLAGELAAADFHFLRALAEAPGDAAAQARLQMRRAEIAVADGDLTAADHHLQRAMGPATAVGDVYLRFHILAWTLNLIAQSEEGGSSVVMLYSAVLAELRRVSPQPGKLLREQEAELHLQMAALIAELTGRGVAVLCPVECVPEHSALESCASDDQRATGAAGEACARDLVTIAERYLASDSPLRIRSQYIRSLLATFRGDAGEALRLAEAVLAQPGSERSEVGALARCTVAQDHLERDDAEGAEAQTRLAIGAFEALGLGDSLDVVQARMVLGRLTYTRGAYMEARDAGERVRRILERHRLPAPYLGEAIEMYALLGDLYINVTQTRDPVRGLADLRRGLALAPPAGLDATRRGLMVDMHLSLARLALSKKEPVKARAEVAEGTAIADGVDLEVLSSSAWLSGELALRAGDAAQAQVWLDQAVERLAEAELNRQPSRHLPLHLDWLHARLLGPEHPEGRRLAGAVRDVLTREPYLADEFLDIVDITAWLSGISR